MTLPRARSLPLLSCISGQVLLAALVMSTEAPARAWAVLPDGTGDAPTIQAAVDSCAPGDSVLVGEGTYVESVSVDVPLSLIGVGMPQDAVISADGAEHCIRATVALDPLIVESLTLLNAAPTGYGNAGGFVVRGGGGLVMTDCRVTDTGSHGTRGVGWSGDTRIRRCEFFALGTSPEPVIACGGSFLEVDQTVIRDTGGAAILATADATHVTGCRFERVTGDRAVVCPSFGELILGENVFVDIGGSAIGEFAPPVGRRSTAGLPGGITPASVRADGNTFVRVLEGALVPFDGVGVLSFSQNIVTGGFAGVVLDGVDHWTPFACNDVWHNDYNWVGGPDLTGQNSNVSAPPLFCAPSSGDYTLAANSPCLPASSPCGLLIGAFEQGCGATAVAQRSWGSIKGLYR